MASPDNDSTQLQSLGPTDFELTVMHQGAIFARRIVRSGEYLIGSAPQADLRLDLPRVCPRHARLSIQGADPFVEDLGTAGGTALNGERVHGRTPVLPSQKIEIGEATIELRALQMPRPGGQADALVEAAVRRLLPDEIIRERKYEVGGVVAHGGMGMILDAREAVICRNVAMKVMLGSRTADDAIRFIHEAQITGQLEHPGIVPIYELGVDRQGQPYYTMKLVRGITLRKVFELLAAGDGDTIARFPLAALLTSFQKVCDTLAFAHSRNVIHRDLKPDNIMIGDFGEVLVMDWGLAKVIGSAETPAAATPGSERDFPAISSVRYLNEESMTMAGAVMGTPQFMAPEQARGEVERLDARTDVYALGAILYQILTLRPPVEGSTSRETIEKARAGRITPPAEVRSPAGGKACWPHLPGGRMPESLSAVCMQALAFDPAKRYPTVAALQAEILAYQTGFATSAERAGLFKQIHLALLRHRIEATILTGSVVLLLGLGVVAFQRVRVERDTAKTERDRAETTLDQLRATAPTFLAQAQALLDEGKLEEALAKIAFAISLRPQDAGYVLFRANLLQSGQRLAEAAAEYRRALALRPGDAIGQKNLALCERLLAANGSPAPLRRECQIELFDALMEQGRGIEAAPLALVLGQGFEAVEAALRARLKEYTTQLGWREARIRRLPNGTLHVNLNGFKLGDLGALLGFPISELELGNTGAPDLRIVAQLPVTKLSLNYNRFADLSPIRNLRLTSLDLRSSTIADLTPLAGMPLTELILNATRINDLSPLKGMPLRTCRLSDVTGVRDLSPLAGMPLEHLDLKGTSARDLAPLRGLPLKTLSLAEAPYADDFSAILDCQSLEELALPFHGVAVPALGNFPKLHRVSISGWTEAHVPLARYRSEILPAAGAYLQLRGVVHAQLGKYPPPHAISRDVDRQLTANLARTRLSDLTGLAGLPIKSLDLSHTKVRDLAPLRGMPLRSLRLDGTPVPDLAPLADLPQLEQLVLPASAANVAPLRKLARLRYISKSWNETTGLPAQTAAEFWTEFDRGQK